MAHKKMRQNQSGFTLLELAMVLIVAGLVLATALPLWHMWDMRNDRARTEQNLQTVREAMAHYYERNGVYPCPAPRIRPDEDLAGAEDCQFNDPFVIKEAEKRGVYAPEGMEIVEGGVPYRKLNIPKSTIVDGWNHLFTYVVSKNLTKIETFDAVGKIAITDSADKSVIDPPGSALWLVLSHGRDASGAFTGEGPAAPCAPDHLDGRNCQRSGNYVSAETALGKTDSFFDDLLVYRTWIEMPPKPYGKFCAVAGAGGPFGNAYPRMMPDGLFIRICDDKKSGEDGCRLFTCQDGNLVPGIIE